MKGLVQQEDTTIINTYALNIGAPKLIKETILTIEEQIGPDTVIVGDLNTSLILTGQLDKN
jgi:hypothetical protein